MDDIIHRSLSLSAWIIPVIILAAVVFPQMVRVLREYERGVIFRLGKLIGAKGPGLMAFTVMPWSASSNASARVRPSNAALLAE